MAIIVILVVIIVRVSKSGGKTQAERDSFAEGQRRRDRFDKAMSKSTLSGPDLIRKLRGKVGR